MANEFVITETLELLQSFGFFYIIVPYMIVFLVCYAILKKFSVFKDKIATALAFFLALFVLPYTGNATELIFNLKLPKANLFVFQDLMSEIIAILLIFGLPVLLFKLLTGTIFSKSKKKPWWA